MTIDPNQHVIDIHTGFAKDKDTGHIVGLEQKPHVSPQGVEWPKWVKPHDSHIVRQKTEGFPDHVSTPGWENSHVNRADGAVTVLVANEDEEKLATGEYQPTKAEDQAPVPDEAIKRAVHADVERAKADQAQAIAKQLADDQAKLEAEEAARRAAEAVERRKAEQVAADELAAAQRKRLDEQLGSPNEIERRRVLSTPERRDAPVIVQEPVLHDEVAENHQG